MVIILQIIGGMNRAGAETMLMNLYRAIDHSRFQFEFLYFTNARCDYDDEIESLGGIIHRLPLNQYKNPISRMVALKRLLDRNKHIQIIHCHTLFSNAFHLWAGKKAGVKMRIAHSHNTSDHSKGKLISVIYQAFSRLLIKKFATHFIACGKAASEFLYTKQLDVFLMPNSIDSKYFSKIALKEKDYLSKMFQLSTVCIKIIQVGRLQTVKNHQFSLLIAKELKRRGVDFKMFFIGQGNLGQEIQNEIIINDLSDDVKLLGIRSDIPQLMAGANVLLMPSLHEGFPVVLVESQAVGLPAVIADTISPEVDLGLGLVSFMSLEDNPGRWVDKILDVKQHQILDVQNRLLIMSEKGFDTTASVKKLEKIYAELNIN